MFAIIVGGGKLGFSVAQLLNEEDYDVTVIEPDEERCRIIDDRLDVITVQGLSLIHIWSNELRSCKGLLWQK